MKHIVLTIWIIITFTSVFAQGLPLMKNFSLDDYGLSPQNWMIKQDSRGFIYVANTEGLMEYDGFKWNILSINSLFSLAITQNKIYVGKLGNIGYYQTDETGKMQYFSLNELIPAEHSNFNSIHKIFVNNGKMFFFAYEKIFIYHKNKFKIISANVEFRNTFFVDNTIFVADDNYNVYHVNNKDELSLVAPELNLSSYRIEIMLPCGENKTYIHTAKGAFILSNEKKSFKLIKLKNFEKIDEILKSNGITNGITLKNNDIAVGTVKGGVIVFDINGTLKEIYDKTSGLASNNIYDIFEDQNGHLWVGLDDGISYIHHNIPFRFFDERAGLEGIPLAISHINNNLYVGTSQNMFVLNPEKQFTRIENTTGQNFDILEAQNHLLIANSSSGIIKVDGTKAKQLHEILSNFSDICPLQGHPNHLLVSGVGLYVMEYTNKEWTLKHKLANFNKDIYFVSQDTDANIWASANNEVLKIKLSTNMDSVQSFQSYNEKGLRGETFVLQNLNSGKVAVSSEAGVFSYNPQNDCFEPHPILHQLKGYPSPITQDKAGNFWFEESLEGNIAEKGLLKFVDGKYEMYKTPFYKFKHLNCSFWANTIYAAPDSSVYFGTNKGILRYNPKVKTDYDIPFNTIIRQVYSKDSLIFDGYFNITEWLNVWNKSDLNFSQNNLKFLFSALFLEDAEKNHFSYRLVGLDTTWSAWTNDHKKEYTNLYEGAYIFEVKSKNEYEKIGKTASFAFRILPPWYRTWWAYTVAFVLMILLIYIILKIYTHRLKKQKEYLEKLVEKRTEEIVQKNKELEQQKEEILLQKNEIEYSHNQITASINYAQRIQNAVLPTSEFIESVLPEHFILFKPKDVVSGDFYFLNQFGEKVLIVAADCTGHGIPGAFMSMLGVALLNEITQKYQSKRTNDILNELRNRVKQSLKQTGKNNEQKDGMDIALCLLDKQTLEMSFAGAYNPCLIYRKIENEINLFELKADRMPIGIHIKEKDFTEQIFQLEKNDMIYIFSDGFHSQFGSENNMKYQVKRLKSFLQSISEQPTSKQKELLEIELKNWQMKMEQTDDILLIGVKI